jgi:hypothetical protein
VQVCGDAFALVLADGDLGKDLFPLQPHIPAVIPDDGDKKVDDDHCYYQRHQESDIKDLRFHH